MIEPVAKAQDAALQFYENIDSREFAKRLGLPLSWIQNHTRHNCDDIIPHVKLGAKVIFEWGSPDLYAWWDRHRKRYATSDTERTVVPPQRCMARGILSGDSDRERGARMATNAIATRTN